MLYDDFINASQQRYICYYNNFDNFAVAFNKLQHVFNVATGRVIFEAWHNVTLDSKKTREYFEVGYLIKIFS